MAPQSRKSWTRGCGANVQTEDDPPSSSNATKTPAASAGQQVNNQRMGNNVRPAGMYVRPQNAYMPPGVGRGSGVPNKMGESFGYAATYR